MMFKFKVGEGEEEKLERLLREAMTPIEGSREAEFPDVAPRSAGSEEDNTILVDYAAESRKVKTSLEPEGHYEIPDASGDFSKYIGIHFSRGDSHRILIGRRILSDERAFDRTNEWRVEYDEGSVKLVSPPDYETEELIDMVNFSLSLARRVGAQLFSAKVEDSKDNRKLFWILNQEEKVSEFGKRTRTMGGNDVLYGWGREERGEGLPFQEALTEVADYLN